ncbi:hypothetical protein BDFB_012747, partial [Asbolus verrucosus]
MKLALEICKNKGKIIKIWWGKRLAVLLMDPRDVEVFSTVSFQLILGSNVHLEKSIDYRFFQPWLETVMGVKKTKEAKSSFRYAKAVMNMCEVLHFRHVRLWMNVDFIFSFTKMFKDQSEFLKIIHSLTDKVIKRKKKDYFDRIQG